MLGVYPRERVSGQGFGCRSALGEAREAAVGGGRWSRAGSMQCRKAQQLSGQAQVSSERREGADGSWTGQGRQGAWARKRGLSRQVGVGGAFVRARGAALGFCAQGWDSPACDLAAARMQQKLGCVAGASKRLEPVLGRDGQALKRGFVAVSPGPV